ncbi:MAG: sigma-54-dependent Fis family transcriptional regulator [Chitinispirillaceae bacterium]|nr:sigma-54-dependent Fis family transcriptional regulator [Chitinispirillaceae bacterium]
MNETKALHTILIVSSDRPFREKLNENLTLQGYSVVEAASQSEALPLLEKRSVEIIFLDFERMPPLEMDIVSYLHMRHHAEIVILTTLAEIEEATSALKSGAAFYLLKPIRFTDLKAVLDKLSIRVDRTKELIELEQRVLSDLMAGSPAMQKTLKLAMKIASTSSTVLINGESGTGKEFFARIIHRMSPRIDGQFVPVNCGAIQDTLFESELFGHKKGAFTGADRDKQGLVEEANLGTLFLDEISELSPPAQVKLLRFLQEREFRRVGETVNRSVDVRVIAASNKDLFKLVGEKKFREDLFYRINVFALNLPPLRERRETIPNLIRLFVHRYNQAYGKSISTIAKGAEAILANYHYPGNVRELMNIIEHAIVLADGRELTERDLPEFMFRNRLLLSGPQSPATPLLSADSSATLAEVEKNHIRQVLELTRFNYTDASKKLGISRSTLWRKIKEYRLETP